MDSDDLNGDPVDISGSFGLPSGRIWWTLEHCDGCIADAAIQLERFKVLAAARLLSPAAPPA